MADGSLSPAARPSAFSGRAPVDLRPLTTSELIDRGFTLYRAHFVGFLLLALLGQTAPLLNQVLITYLKINSSQNEILENPGLFAGRMAVMLGVTLFAQMIVFCFEIVMTYYISDAYLGKIPSITGSMRKFTTRIAASIWTCALNMFLIGLTFFFPFLAILAVYFTYLVYPPLQWYSLLLFGSATLLLITASLVPVLIVFMRLWVIAPGVALEGLSGWKALKRSSALVRYDPGLGLFYWGEMRLSFLLLPLFVIEMMILMLTSAPLIIFQAGEAFRHGSGGQIVTPPDATVILSQIMTFFAGSLIWPLYVIATTLFYYDVRIRSEGFDLEFMAMQLGDGK